MGVFNGALDVIQKFWGISKKVAFIEDLLGKISRKYKE